MTTTFIPIYTPQRRRFQDRPTGGQAQRQGSGQWEGLVNRQQRRLVKTFDAWAAPVKDGILTRAQAGQEPTAILAWVDRQMPALETDMIDVTNKGIIGTARTVAGERFDQPAILGISQKQVRDNTALVRANLVPNIRDKIAGALIDGRFRTRAALNGVFNRIRPMPAQYAGGAWVAIFETERGLGTMREQDRAAAGLVPEPIRWVLDPRAEHCADSPGFHGCPSLAGEYQTWNDLPAVPAGQVTCRGNAVLPGNIVDATLIELASRMHYSGPAFKLTTQAGIEVTVTANHPVLTPQGWMKAKFLRKGDYVVNSTGSQAPMVIVDNDHEDVPAFVEKVWDALAMVSGIYGSPLSPIVPHDFHGDGRFMDGNVEIVLPYSQLWRQFDSRSLQAVDDGPLRRRLLAASALTADGAVVEIDRPALAAANGLVIRGQLMRSGFGGHLTPLQLFSFTSPTKVDSLSFERVGDSPTAHAQILRQLQHTFARVVTLDQLVDVVQFQYSGHVYDLQTDVGYYLANSVSQRHGMVLSNCRCHIEVFRDGEWQRGVFGD
jgi:hypothetical protein